MKPSFRSTTLPLALACSMLGACSGGTETGPTPAAGGAFRNGLPPAVRDGDKLALVDRSTDYSMALRSAALKLVANYPTLAEMQQLDNATDKQAAYETLIDQYIADPRFTIQMITFFNNTFKMAGAAVPFTDPKNAANIVNVNLDFAPNYAAKLVVDGDDFRKVVTATTDTCFTYAAATNTFALATCGNTNPQAGILTDAGVQAQYFSTMAFRRLRFVQETFTCSRFPAETTGAKVAYPGGTYQSPWDINTITGAANYANAPVDFLSTSSLICANCHTTMNHQAPLFGKFDFAGKTQSGFMVYTPATGSPAAVLLDWLPPGQATAWRFQKPAANLQEFGQAMAADPAFATCISNRIWNWAISRGDVVNDQATLTTGLATQLTTQLSSNAWNVKKLVRSVFVGANFVRF